MPDGVTVKVEGLANMERKMFQFADDVNRKAILQAARAWAKIMRQAIDARLRSSLKSHTGKSRAGVRITYRIRSRGVQGATVWFNVGYGAETFYLFFQEHGYYAIGRGKGQRFQHRRLRKAGKGLGKFYRKAFVKPAFDASVMAALDALSKTLGVAIEHQANAA